MKKTCLTILVAALAVTGQAMADGKSHQHKGHGNKKEFNVDVEGMDSHFQITVTSKKDHDRASELEVKAFAVVMPRKGEKPGMIRLRVMPTEGPKTEVVGPHQGQFMFQVAQEEETVANAIPQGKYLLVVNGNRTGLLTIDEEGARLEARKDVKPAREGTKETREGKKEARKKNREERKEKRVKKKEDRKEKRKEKREDRKAKRKDRKNGKKTQDEAKEIVEVETNEIVEVETNEIVKDEAKEIVEVETDEIVVDEEIVA